MLGNPHGRGLPAHMLADRWLLTFPRLERLSGVQQGTLALGVAGRAAVVILSFVHTFGKHF